MSRKPISIVETVLHANCSLYNKSRPYDVPTNDTTWCDWKPFDKDDVYQLYFAGLDYAFQFAYAIAMFFSGHLAERINLRIFLCCGMMLSGVATAFFGLGQIFRIHSLPYYIIIQIIAGVFQSSGWPAVVTLVGNWFGNARKGLIFGIWNSHTSIGNILGNSFAELFLPEGTPDKPWAWSFILPGAIIASFGILAFLFVIPHPSDIGIRDDDAVDSPTDYTDTDDEREQHRTVTPPRTSRLPEQSYVTPPQPTHHHHHPPNFISTYGTETHLSMLNTSANPVLAEGHRQYSTGHNRNHITRRSNGNGAGRPEQPPASAVGRAHQQDQAPTIPINVNDSDVEGGSSNTGSHALATAVAEQPPQQHNAVTFVDALRIPGVVEFSLCLFFAKCVSYTFLYWLPHFIKQTHPDLSAGNLASVFDVGGIVGGISAGLLSDVSRMPACVSAGFLILSMPALYALDVILEMSVLPGSYWLICILGVAGAAVNGPYALITTAVSTELGTHPCLHGNSRAVATVTAIIDGTGSLGAAIGPAMVGILTTACGLSCVFQSLMVAQLIGMLLLVRLVYHEIRRWLRARRRRVALNAAATPPLSRASTNNNGSHIAND